jgi:hypothetical protein
MPGLSRVSESPVNASDDSFGNNPDGRFNGAETPL